MNTNINIYIMYVHIRCIISSVNKHNKKYVERERERCIHTYIRRPDEHPYLSLGTFA